MSDLDDFVNDPVISDDECCVHCGGEYGKHHNCPQVKARAELEALRAENARLREALKPLAEVADHMQEDMDDDTGIWSDHSNFRKTMRLTLGDARRARAALEA